MIKNKQVDKMDKKEKKLKRLIAYTKKYDSHMSEDEEQEFIKEQKTLTEASKKISAFMTFKQLWFLILGARKKLPWLFILMVSNSLLELFSISLVIPFMLFLQNAHLINVSSNISSMGFVKRNIIEFSRYLYDIFEFTSTNQLIIFFGIVFFCVLFLLRLKKDAGID